MIDGVHYFIFADDTAFVATHSDPEVAVTHLQVGLPDAIPWDDKSSFLIICSPVLSWSE